MLTNALIAFISAIVISKFAIKLVTLLILPLVAFFFYKSDDTPWATVADYIGSLWDNLELPMDAVAGDLDYGYYSAPPTSKHASYWIASANVVDVVCIALSIMSARVFTIAFYREFWDQPPVVKAANLTAAEQFALQNQDYVYRGTTGHPLV